ncbi:MAG: DUF1003 domain-containing protein [Candidatus Pacebacteria bacterium]|nr:DUF1003 domain-containing protein [Candidatus Paceibacterota bacterium]
MKKNHGQQGLLDKISHTIAWFMGSWWGITAHTLWFAVWLAADWNIHLLTLILSMEAIYIGIFLLMAANEAEREREQRGRISQERTMKILNQDLILDKKAEKRQEEIVKMIRQLKKNLKI